jgi:Sulfatase-modifying factor enzyme 1
MSPEQARGSVLDGRADLYSLGVVTYELLSGDLPFHAADTLAMALAHVEQPIPRLPSALRRWQGFIDKAMAKNTADRFQSAAQMQGALDAIEASLNPGANETNARVFGLRPIFGVIAATVLTAIGAGMLATAILRLHDASSSASTNSSEIAPIPVVEAAPKVSIPAGETIAAEKSLDEKIDSAAMPEPIASDVEAAAATPSSITPARDSTNATKPLAEPPELIPGTTLHDHGGPLLAFVPAARMAGVHGFALGRYEVTRGEYAAFVQATGHPASKCLEPMQPLSRLRSLTWSAPGFVQNERHPVVCVSWNDATAYAQWLSGRTHATYRLPSRAEWLHAARLAPADIGVCAQGNLAGRGLLSLHIGSALCRHGFDRTAPAGRFKPNTVGIYDLVGNVSEWVMDCKEFGIDAQGRCAEHLFAGTSWRDDAGTNNLEAIGDAAADVGYTTVGIRLLRTLSADNMPAIEH